MMKMYAKCAVVIFWLWTFAAGGQQHLVCKTLDDVFTEGTGSEPTSHVRRLQCPPPPGKRGIRGVQGITGVPGDTGPPGAPAVVDYDRINQVITEKVASAFAEINSKFTDLEKNITEIHNELQGSWSCQGFYYRKKCYTIPEPITCYGMDYNHAVAECAKTGALVAEIYNRDHQNALYNFVVSKRPLNLRSGTTMLLWLGMKYGLSD